MAVGLGMPVGGNGIATGNATGRDGDGIGTAARWQWVEWPLNGSGTMTLTGRQREWDFLRVPLGDVNGAATGMPWEAELLRVG